MYGQSNSFDKKMLKLQGFPLTSIGAGMQGTVSTWLVCMHGREGRNWHWGGGGGMGVTVAAESIE